MKNRCAPVTSPFGDDIKEQVSHMVKVMRLLNGVGIAANQLGYSNRIFIAWFGAREDEDVVPMINPETLRTDGPWVDMREACLSCDGCVGHVRRRDFVTVKWFDVDGCEHTERYSGWDARIIQHETDHLNGICIADKFNSIDELANRYEMERLSLQAGILPKRMKKRGYNVLPRNVS